MARHIYVHVPFCEAKCPYCSFYSVTSSELAQKYWDAINYELEHSSIVEDINEDEVDTVYFGGGTPSSQPAQKICDFLRAIISKFDINPESSEITIEVNPHSLTEEKAKAYREAGFNRVSIGVQSLHDSTLKTLGRLHDSETAKNAIRILKSARFTNISADLIIGVPNQLKEEVLDDASYLLGEGIKHISMYSLSIEPGTSFEKRYPHLEDVVSEDYEREMYHGLSNYLSENGVIPYEISNCAAPGMESKHNSSYWEGCEYYAFGAGAHGYLNSVRFGHPDDVCEYIDNPCGTYEEETLTVEDKMGEFCMLMLRKASGVNMKEFKKRFGRDFEVQYSDILKRCIDKGFLEISGDNVRLTNHGLDFANLVFAEFI